MNDVEQFQFIDRLTPEEARNVDLSLNPIKRLGQLAEYGAAFGSRKIGMSPLPMYMTRGDLIRSAEAHQKAHDLLESIKGLPSDEAR